MFQFNDGTVVIVSNELINAEIKDVVIMRPTFETHKIPNTVRWNPVNTDTKGTCHTTRIIRVPVLSGLSEKSVADSRFIDLETKADIFTGGRCFLHFMPVTVTSLVKRLHLSYHSLGLRLRSKRFHLVSEQKKNEERDFRFWPPEKWSENQKMKQGETLTPNPALLLAPFFARSLTLVPRSLLLNRTETLATKAISD